MSRAVWFIAALAVTGCRGGGGSKEHVVTIHEMRFDPPRLVVSPGDRVTWRNEDLVAHTATSAGFDSGEIASGKSATVTLHERGQVSYTCRLHPTMAGALEVR